MIGLPIRREARGRLKKHKLANNGVNWFIWAGERHCTFSIYVAPCLGTGLGTTKSTKTAQVPSEATPGKRDIVFDFVSHNPKVVGSNPTPATNFLKSRAGSRRPACFLFRQLAPGE